MKIYLCAQDQALFKAWQLYCGGFEFVEPTMQSILHIPAEVLVSPANSFGVMTGGIDGMYRNYFGKEMETNLQRRIDSPEFGGELFIGQATSVPIHHPEYSFKFLVSAPTMRTPENVSHTLNVYLATRGALREAIKLGQESIVFPGMGTGTGCVSPDDCAKQMAAAIKSLFIDRRVGRPEGLYEEQDYVIKNAATSKWLKAQYDE